MPLLKIDEDLNKKKNISTEKLSLLIQPNSYFVGCDVSVQLLQPILLSFPLKYKENHEKRQEPNILKLYIGKLKKQEAKLKFGLCPPNIGSSGKM